MPRVCIVAAHPDDESIGASSVLRPDGDVVVIHVTNGAPHDPRWWPPGIVDRLAYVRVREREAERAISRVGGSRIALGFDDQEVVFQLATVITVLAATFARVRPDLIVTHAYEGGHPDHDAVAVAVARSRGRIPAVEMALYHGARGSFRAGEFIERDRAAVRYTLTAAERQRRHELLGAYASQHDVLQPFSNIAVEWFRPAREHDVAQPPHDGPLHYERLGMKPSAEAWRRAARVGTC